MYSPCDNFSRSFFRSKVILFSILFFFKDTDNFQRAILPEFTDIPGAEISHSIELDEIFLKLKIISIFQVNIP